MGNICQTSVFERRVSVALNSLKIGERVVQLIQGDLSEEKVDVLVYPSNVNLHYSHDIGQKLLSRGGPALEDQLEKILLPVSVGEIFVISPGNLRCKKLVHYVGPIFCDGKRNESSILMETLTKTMQLVEESGFQTVALPLVDSGPFAFPVREFAFVFFQILQGFMSSRLKEIRIVSPDAAALKNFEDEIKKLRLIVS